MKFTLSWLHEYCRCEIAPAKLEELLTNAGLKVEAMTPLDGGELQFELELTANRPDCLGLLGVAREVALLAGADVRLPKVEVPSEARPEADGVRVAIEEAELCPRYIARVLKGVRVAPSPAWLVKRLESVGLLTVNNVVDVTNFVLYETGQPLHAFDLGKLAERRIAVRRARAGEKIAAIDGKTYGLSPANLVIADGRGPVAVAGVMGGAESEVSERTTDLLLECAYFAPASVRRTSRELALKSDSSYRFERGVNPAQLDWVARRAAALIKEVAGGLIVPSFVDVGSWKPEDRRVTLRAARLEKLLGRRIESALVSRILRGLGFELLSESDERWEVRVPAHRADVALEADLGEEIARIYGYDRIPTTPRVRIAPVPESTVDRMRRRTRELLVGAGLFECLTHSFLDERYVEDFAWAGDGAPVGLLNRDGKVGTMLRKSVLPGLLLVARTNDAHAAEAPGFFEIAKSYFHGADGKPAERACLALVHREGFAAARGALDLA
ncbi:MAG: phenylalanine--tRNA ligase subunit beta, partial [Planctomycetes bacterium]|nr:phenylalanine--tRNA ligase subunit beta [Planctomycetota bacterium]